MERIERHGEQLCLTEEYVCLIHGQFVLYFKRVVYSFALQILYFKPVEMTGMMQQQGPYLISFI